LEEIEFGEYYILTNPIAGGNCHKLEKGSDESRYARVVGTNGKVEGFLPNRKTGECLINSTSWVLRKATELEKALA
jgi:hypothetical protein